MRLRHRRQTVHPRYRFATSQSGVNEITTIVVELEHDGVVGLGEAAPAALYGQSLQSCESALAGIERKRDLGDDPFAIEPILDRLIERYDDQRAVIAAIDSALHDWVGKRLGLPTWRLLGLERPRTRTTFTIGVAEPAEIRQKVNEALAAGYDALKVKVGAERDHETLRIVREVFDGPLLLDANQAWQPEEAADKVRSLARYRPSMIEQPVPREHWQHMAELRRLGVAPIFADESCERPADVVRLRECVDGVNIKFTKCGGIREALRMIWLARTLGLQVMLGCFVSSSLAIAPALAISTRVDLADLDGHLLLADDPFEGIARCGSVIELSDRPGLGIGPRA